MSQNDYSFSSADMINARDRFAVKPRPEPKLDEAVSKVVGKKVFVNDPKLIRLVAKWKQETKNPDDSVRPDNFLRNEEKVKELKKMFG